MKKIVLVGIFLFSALVPAVSSHIVGGEIELIYKRGNVYQIVLKMYADVLNATPGVIASEVDARVGIFEKYTNTLMAKKTLERQFTSSVSYGATCENQPGKTIKTVGLHFFADILLDPNIYNSPNGYYMVWENCCRNGVIANIQNPFNEGMAFYTEFPPLIKNGARFYNSSPQFDEITGDFPCVGKPFTFDFSGIDHNGDSLAYRLTTPLAGHVGSGGFTDPQSGPYDSIIWKPGFSRTNQIPGSPALTVNPITGKLNLVANQTGLFVFSVTVDEFRNGEKIGEVKRDFQFLITNCEDNEPPSIDFQLPDGTAYDPGSDTISLSVDADTSFTVLVSDSNTLNGDNENLSIRVINSTLPPGVLSINPNVLVTPGNDTIPSDLNFNACDKLFIKKDTFFTISLLVTDAPKCPMSIAFYDTITITVQYKPESNFKPHTDVIGVTGPVTATVGNQTTFNVYGTDQDNLDIITLSASGVGFSMADKGMTFDPVSGQDSIYSTFRWVPDCEDALDGTKRIQFLVDDNSCIPENRDTVYVDIVVEDTATDLPNISPVNLFTPNGDKLNDVFEIPNIPEGNCNYFFKRVTIYNRWGAKVYENEDPGFKWDGSSQPSGLYYFLIDINEKEFKGWINLVR